jgi:hypothetical protein
MLTGVEAPTPGALRTRVAVLGTMGPLHAEPMRYDLVRLRRAVEEIEPDLLGVEADPLDWARGDVEALPLEVRKALVPASQRIDTVVVPMGGGKTCGFILPATGFGAGLRSSIILKLDGVLVMLQRRLGGPEDVNAPLFKHTCELVCAMEALASTPESRQAWAATNAEILNGLLSAVRRDPGRRVLLAVQCRRIHWFEQRLRKLCDEVELVPFNRL